METYLSALAANILYVIGTVRFFSLLFLIQTRRHFLISSYLLGHPLFLFKTIPESASFRIEVAFFFQVDSVDCFRPVLLVISINLSP